MSASRGHILDRAAQRDLSQKNIGNNQDTAETISVLADHNMVQNDVWPAFRLIANIDGWQEADVNGETKKIPKNWTVSTFGDLGGFKTGSDHKKQPPGGIAVYGSSSTPMKCRVGNSIHPGNTFIIGRKGTIDKPFFVESSFWCVDTGMFFCGNGRMDERYGFYQATKIEWASYNAGTTLPSLTQTRANQIEIACPELGEQQRIAAVLSAQEAQIQDLRTLRDTEQARLAWLTNELLSGRVRVVERAGTKAGLRMGAKVVVTAVTEEKAPEEGLVAFELVSNRDGWKAVEVNGEARTIPKTWEVCKLGTNMNFKNGDAHKPSDLNQTHEGMRVVRIQNLTDSDASYNYTKRSGLLLIDEGSVILSWSATIETFVWRGATAALNQHLFLVTPTKCFPSYAKIAIDHSIKYIRSLAHGATMKHVRKGEVESTESVFPPIHEQRRIAAVLSAQERQVADFDALIQAEQQRLAWLTDELLSGRIRVVEE